MLCECCAFSACCGPCRVDRVLSYTVRAEGVLGMLCILRVHYACCAAGTGRVHMQGNTCCVCCACCARCGPCHAHPACCAHALRAVAKPCLCCACCESCCACCAL